MRCPSDVQLVMSSQCGLQGEAGLETLRPSFLVGMVGKVLTLRDGTKDWVWPQQPQVGKMRRNRARKMRGGGRGAEGVSGEEGTGPGDQGGKEGKPSWEAGGSKSSNAADGEDKGKT